MHLSSILAAKGGAVVTIAPDATVGELVALLAERGIGAAVVSGDGSTIAGIVSERDVVRSLAGDATALDQPVAGIMTTTVFCAPPDATVEDLMHLMTDRRVRHIPVTDAEGALQGIVSIGDVVKARLGELEGERAALLGYITNG
jgi:CBS domain-containing protein